MATTPSTPSIAPKLPEHAELAPSLQIFCGQFPESVSLMTEAGQPVYFYKCFHTTDDPDVITFLNKQKNIKNVTGEIKLSEVPVAPRRQQGRNWQANESPSEITPAELLRRVASSATMGGNTQESNS